MLLFPLSLPSSLAESVGLQYAEITVLERENNQPEERMREVECCVYANVQRGQ